jgi:pre-mRNA-splicing factor SYF1
MYLGIFTHPMCPPMLSLSHARKTFDRALRTLPPSLHFRVWIRYLIYAENRSNSVMVSLYRRYLKVDPSITEHYIDLLLNEETATPRPLEAAKLLLGLARSAAQGSYVSPNNRSAYQLLEDWMGIVEKYPEEVGLDSAEVDASNVVAADGEDTNLDPRSSRKLNIERIVREDGLEIYKDQAGRLWTGLATYWINRGEFDRAKKTFENGISSVLTIRDFTQIFDAYAEFSESLISALMDKVADEDEDEDKDEAEEELDVYMKDFEALMDRRPFLVNDVLLRRNPNDVQEWEKRIALWGDNDEKVGFRDTPFLSQTNELQVAETYNQALATVNPKKATANMHRLYVNFAKFYEEGGTGGQAESDLGAARQILEKATKVQFKTVEELAEVYCEWSEMELRHENYDEAIRVIQRVAVVPKNPRISYHDQVSWVTPDCITI